MASSQILPFKIFVTEKLYELFEQKKDKGHLILGFTIFS